MATMNGFAENGGKALVQMLRQNNVIKKVDISANRITDAVLKSLSYSLDQFEGLTFLSVSHFLVQVLSLNLHLTKTM